MAQDKKWRIGFSQATTIEPWRAQFNKDIIAEAAKHPEVELIITDGEDKTEKQVADVENLIRQEVNAILISPKESAGLTGVVLQAIDAKIPVFVLDRNVDTDKYVQFVGGDNKLIGPRGGRICRRPARRQGQGNRQCRRDLGRHGHAAGP
jgi:ribose transport system substrate-binding protein